MYAYKQACVLLFDDGLRFVVTEKTPPTPCAHMAYNNKFLTKSKPMYPRVPFLVSPLHAGENGIKPFECFCFLQA